jgi:hypothetical protein
MGRMTTPMPASFGNLVVINPGTIAYTPSKNAKLLVVHCVGGGGSGGGGVTGGAAASSGSGGGAAATRRR